MKLKICTFAEDTENNGTASHVFTDREKYLQHIEDIITDSYGDEIQFNEETKEWQFTRVMRDCDECILDLLNERDIEQAFSEWESDSSYRSTLDTFYRDEVEIDVPLPRVDALIEALKLARRTFTDDPTDYEYLEHHIICRKDILKKIDDALASSLAATSPLEVVAAEFLKQFGPYIDNDEELPGPWTVDRIAEFVAAFRNATPTAPKIVTVEVSGGVAEATDVPEGVDVKIIDHDNDNG